MGNNHKSILTTLSPLIFWGYNLTYVIFASLVLLNLTFSTFGPNENLSEILTFGGAPVNVLIMIYGLIITPFISIALAFFTRLYKDSRSLLKLFFGFEIPLMGLMLTRIIFFRQVTPVVWLLFLAITMSVVGLLMYLFYPHIRSKVKVTFLMLSQQIALLIAGYIFLLAFFFLPIIVAFFFKMLHRINIEDFITGLFSVLTHGGFLPFLLYLFFIILFLLTVGFFTLGPIGACITFWKNCQDLYKKLIHEHGLRYSRLTRYGISFLFVLFALVLSIQTNANKYTTLIADYKKAVTFEDKQHIAQEIVKRDREIKNNLVSSYLAQYRYLSDEKMNLLKQGYQNELGTSESSAQFMQRLFNTIALPFIYRGAFEEDIKASSENYKELFDNSIQKGELETIVKTLESANTRDSLKAGILDIHKKTVRLVSKTITATSHNDGLLAHVTIEEEYENTSNDPQEVYYEFSLPDNAVVTELKLGPDLEIGANAADKPLPSPTSTPQSAQVTPSGPTPTPQKVDTAVVAPKGAASTTYEAQIFRRTDPALLAQVGPRQYKLRIFPIPAKGWTLEGRPTKLPQKNQKVRYSYVALVTSQGIPLPIVTEQRNIFLDNSTKVQQTVNGIATMGSSNTREELKFLPFSQSASCFTKIYEFESAGGNILFIPHTANPALSKFYSCKNGFSLSDRTISGLRIAFLLDASYSNTKKNWSTSIKESFSNATILKNNTVDLYFFNDTVSKGKTVTEDTLTNNVQVVSLGKTDRMNAISSVVQQYNLILMLTDEGTFDTTPKEKTISTNTPVYIIHPGGEIPPYNDVLTNVVIQTNGEIVENGREALHHYWQVLQLRALNQMGTVLDTNEFGTWILRNPSNRQAVATITPLRVDSQSLLGLLAQKMMILGSIRQAGSAASSLEFLDQIHHMSQQSFIVTPYSSMIVLVTEEQKRQLAEATKQNNRYQLALDLGEERIGDPSGKGILQVGAVPEPHEWVLIISGVVLLAYFYKKRIMVILQPVYESYRKKNNST